MCVVVCHFFECLTSIIESQATAPAISLLNNYAATAPTLPDSKLSNSKQYEEKHPNITISWLKLYIFKSGWIYTFSSCRPNLSLVGSESSPISSPQREAKGADLVGTLTKKIKSKLLHDYSSTTADVFSGHPMRSTGLMSRLLFFHRLLWLKVTTPRKRAKPICF